jgi:hypothetical protein
MTPQTRLENYDLYKMTQDEQYQTLLQNLRETILSALLRNDAVERLSCHEAFEVPFKKAMAEMSLPADFKDPAGNPWEVANEAFAGYCAKIPLSVFTTAELESMPEETLEALTDNQLFVHVLLTSDRLNLVVDQFLTQTGAKAKIMRAGLPFEPSMAEKRILALITALLAPEAEPNPRDQILSPNTL